MRKFIMAGLMMAVAGSATAASAQSAAEVRRDARDVREDRRDLRQAQRHGDRGDVREARGDLRDSRRELRGDWRDYRRTHGDVFRGPAYVGPRGYAYRPIAAGHRFAAPYYGRRYWVDAARYRLPAAGANRRWVRYGNDVALVNLRTGRVISVYDRFFY